MTYLDRVNFFWSVHEAHPFQPTGIALHFYLLKVANARFWKGPYRVPSSQICGALQIDKKTLQRARNALKQAGVLDFANGKADHSPTAYTFLSPAERAALLTTGGKRGGTVPPVGAATGGVDPLVTPPETPPVTPPVAPPVRGTIGGEEDKDKDQDPSNKQTPQTSPDLAQVLAEAERIGCSPQEATRFWHHFNAVGWRTKNDQPITRWPSKLAVWWADSPPGPQPQRTHEHSHARRHGKQPIPVIRGWPARAVC